MISFINMLKWMVVICLITPHSLIAKDSPYLLIDPEHRLDKIGMLQKVKKEQQKFYQKYDCCVSYAIIAGDLTKSEVKITWEDFVKDDAKKKFHILISIIPTRQAQIVEIIARNQPGLQSTDVEKIFKTRRNDISSELDLKSALETSFSVFDEELKFIIKDRVKYDVLEKEKKAAAEELAFRNYLKTILYILAAVVGGLVGILSVIYLWITIRNKRPYRFPEITPKKRLGAPYAATSISQLNKK